MRQRGRREWRDRWATQSLVVETARVAAPSLSFVARAQKAPSGGCASFAFSLLAIARRRSISTDLMVLPRTQLESTDSFFESTCIHTNKQPDHLNEGDAA